MLIGNISDKMEKFKEKCKNHLRFHHPEITTQHFGERPSRLCSVHKYTQIDSMYAILP